MPKKESIFILEYQGEHAGCIAVKDDGSHVAQLRYFFLEPEVRGLGAGEKNFLTMLWIIVGKRLSSRFLWTVSAQKTARHLYEKHGFVITEPRATNEWGTEVLEERWDTDL